MGKDVGVSDDTIKNVGRIVAGSYYDMQEVRISTLSRIRDVIRKKTEGIAFDAVEEKKDKDAKESRNEYADAKLPELLSKLKEEGKLSIKEEEYIRKCLDISLESQKIESKYKTAMEEYIQLEIIYTRFLQHIRGIGPVLSANLIKEFQYCEKYDTVSKLWAHTGNSVVNGKAPRKEKGVDLEFSPKLRTLTWKISDCLLKSNHGLYRSIYDSEKAIQSARVYAIGELLRIYPKGGYKAEDTKLRLIHSHNRALRKMRKLFLSHYWACARECVGLENRMLYVEEKLGHKNIITWQTALTREEKTDHDIIRPKKVKVDTADDVPKKRGRPKKS